MKSWNLIHTTLFAAMIFAAVSCKKDPEPQQTENREKIIEIKTSEGSMYMWLYKETPQHRDNFLKLVSEGFYDSTTFHRVIPDFVIQGGDPNSQDSDSTNDGFGGPGYTIPAEFVSGITHKYGAVGAARNNNPAKASNGSQFYIVTDVNGEHTLDMNYTVFGYVFSGMSQAVNISKKPRNANNRPYTDVKMDLNVVEKTLTELKNEFGFQP